MKNLGLYLVIALGFGIYGYMTEADRDETGAIIDGGRVDAFEIKQGDCFDDSKLDDGNQQPAWPAMFGAARQRGLCRRQTHHV